MPGRSIREAIHLTRRLIELYEDGKNDLFMMFINPENRVPRKILWRCIKKKEVLDTSILGIVQLS